MKSKVTLSILFALLTFASAPAKADFLTSFLIDASVRLAGSAVRGVAGAIKDAVVPKESADEKATREQGEVEQAVDQILSQYPEDQRDAMRPQLTERMSMTSAQYQTMVTRQEAIQAEQNSVGDVLLKSTVGAASGAFGSRMTIDAAARAASFRSRF